MFNQHVKQELSSALVAHCSPVLVQDVASGLRQLCQVGQQRSQVVELCPLVVTFSAEDLHQLGQTNFLLEDLKHHSNILSLITRHCERRQCQCAATRTKSLCPDVKYLDP